ncbi:lipid A deacylase LpxR family protein [Hyphococcus sp.]|uniref:lipid A deacylase LpxR family protein n=1 Tax=Hyphococcus sp. TaxID=2038636 RepID=UPI0035C68268
MNKTAGFTALLASFAVFSTAPLRAEDAPAAAFKDDGATWSFVWENDYFADTDRNYTNGVRISYLSALKKPEGVSSFLAYDLLGAHDDAGVRRGFAVGHSIFTPEDTAATQALPDQHPYAGWLYGEYTVAVEQRNRVHQITLQAGVVGPAAQGEWLQNNWHDLIDGDPVNGWDNQIGNEPGFVISYDRQFRTLHEFGDGGFGADITPSVGVSLGNVDTRLRGGFTLRIGRDLDVNPYGPPRVRPALTGIGSFTPSDRVSWYFFAGVNGAAVAHNIFLDGSLFRDGDPSVDKNVLVGEVQAGLALQFRRVQLAYTYVTRTKEFEMQTSAQRFGAVSVSVKF